TLAPVCLVPCVGIFVLALNRPMKRHQRDAIERAAQIEAQLVDTITGIQTVKALRSEAMSRVRIEARFAEMLDAGFLSQMFAAHCATLTTVASGLSGIALLWLGGHQVLAGTMTVGELMALNTMLGMFTGPLDRLSNANQ